MHRTSLPEVLYQKGVLGNFAKFTGKHLRQSLFFNKETLAQMFSCEFCEISKNTFSHRTPPVAASECNLVNFLFLCLSYILLYRFSPSTCNLNFNLQMPNTLLILKISCLVDTKDPT